ncbi:FeoA family protein [Phaeocystidibacter luteus]|uniref:Ferrous iron transport protein A n=1 Tax=Phaeocystidibacter luteus TaxID=911197 RepID=A0A6N6RJE5_9FLAO|nr:FeoA family protein [Phaeocystidibacter luteus]KAB2813804.1 ferrous iron transport protein A [Phaeocystidibacter luteus]NVK27306.1 ferrous iron transport protein A [Flavobacteriia bacterium]
MRFKSAADLRVGERGVIRELSLDELPVKLLEMGCLPGTELEVKHVAPFNGPIYFRMADYHLAIRRELARLILLEDSVEDVA